MRKIKNDPVLWARAFIVAYNAVTKKDEPWNARWYQAEMMRDDSQYKVYLNGRRTGKTEVLCVESMYRTCNNRNFVALFATPYESQIRLIFNRLNELFSNSPLLKGLIVSSTKNPFSITLSNGSRIIGFTTGAKTNSGASSLRGQRADCVLMDETDYMADGDFDTINALAAERNDIRMICSSTPTGHRSKFYELCTNPKLGFSLHHHPSQHNPNFTKEMDEQFKEQLSASGYQHEILAEFGTEEAGVFNKTHVDMAMQLDNYAYNELSIFQREKCVRENSLPNMMLYSEDRPFNDHPFICAGVDWDKYGAASSILVLIYDKTMEKFRVLKRYEIPRTEYSYDTAINTIIEMNMIYNPSWIYCDAGSGEYQIERLHIYGDEHPESGLKVKVKRWQFATTIDIMDPVTKELEKKPMKPFMVNQLAAAFEQDRIILSPYDEILHKQLIDWICAAHS